MPDDHPRMHWFITSGDGDPEELRNLQRVTDYSEHHPSKETSVSKLTDGSFWADTISRAGRQALQAAIPVLAIISGGSLGGLDVADAVTAVAIAAAFTVLKALAGLTSGPDAPVWQQAVERAVAAAAGVGLGLSIVSWADVAATDWAAVGTAALGAALLSVAQLFVDPPTKAGDFALAA